MTLQASHRQQQSGNKICYKGEKNDFQKKNKEDVIILCMYYMYIIDVLLWKKNNNMVKR